MTPLVDVILPCLDEAGALPWVLGRLPAGWIVKPRRRRVVSSWRVQAGEAID